MEQENKHLISLDEFREMARSTSKHVDEKEVMAFVREVEDITIIPAFGLDVCVKLMGDDEELTDDEKILLNGGSWVQKVDGRCEGQNGLRRKCSGLKQVVAYFAYAKMLMSDGGMMTRTGMMQHNDEYASREEQKAKVKRYNDVMEVAESYLDGCLQFWKSVKGDEVKKVRGSRVHVHAIGD